MQLINLNDGGTDLSDFKTWRILEFVRPIHAPSSHVTFVITTIDGRSGWVHSKSRNRLVILMVDHC